MKIPKRIRIGGVDYEILYTPKLNDSLKMCYGYISYEKSTIEINPDETEHQKRCLILWHEILHGIAEHANLQIENEEQVIDVLAKGVYQVLQDNYKGLFDLDNRGDSP